MTKFTLKLGLLYSFRPYQNIPYFCERNMNRGLLIALFCSLPSIYAQSSADERYDTAKRIDPIQQSHDQFFYQSASYKPIDSSFLYLQQYDKTKVQNIGIQNLGDVNTPFISQVYKPYVLTGARLGLLPFDNLNYTLQKSQHAISKVPFTQAAYAQGKGGRRGMIDFDVYHSQSHKRLDFSVDYHSTTNDGFYARQSLSAKNLLFNTYYHSKNNRHLAAIVFAWNKTNFMESAGNEQTEATETLFKALPSRSRIVNVSLNNAKNIYRASDLSLQNAYFILYDKTQNKGLLAIKHNITFTKNSNYYTDAGTDFKLYQNQYYFNSKNSTDSVLFKQVSNSIEVYTPDRQQAIIGKAGIQTDQFRVLQWANKNNYTWNQKHNHSVYAEAVLNWHKYIQSSGYAQWFADGYNQGDYLLHLKHHIQFDALAQWQLNGQLLINNRSPFIKQSQAFNNHYVWQNELQKTKVQGLIVDLIKQRKNKTPYGAMVYGLPKTVFDIQAGLYNIDGYTYFNTSGQIEQINSSQQCAQIVANTHLNAGHFQWHQSIAFQKFGQTLADKILLPNWVSKTSLYYQKHIFKQASFIQFGIDASICASYTAGFYNPALQNFMLSNQSVGAYPFIDAFINAEIKTARIFFKIEHINQNLQAVNTYPNFIYTSPYQPSAPMRMRIGFIWKFYY